MVLQGAWLITNIVAVVVLVIVVIRWARARLQQNALDMRKLDTIAPDQLETGDLLLFQSSVFSAQFTRFVSGGKYSHVGLVIADRVWHIGSAKKTPSLDKLTDLVARYKGIVVCRRLLGAKKPDFEAWRTAIQQQIEYEYDASLVSLNATNQLITEDTVLPLLPVFSELKSGDGEKKKSKNIKPGISCGVLIMEVLQLVRIVRITEDTVKILPKHFAADEHALHYVNSRDARYDNHECYVVAKS